MTWASAEHGLSLFAASILALKPVVQLVSKSWTSLTGSLGSDSKRSTGRDTPGIGGGGGLLKPSDYGTYTPGGTELGSIGVRRDVYVDTSRRREGERMRGPLYTAEVNGSHGSQRGLVGGAGLQSVLEAGKFM